MHKATFDTVVGDIQFGKEGEWVEDRMLAAQFQNIKRNSIDEFRDLKTEVVVYPPDLKSGEVIYPYENALDSTALDPKGPLKRDVASQ